MELFGNGWKWLEMAEQGDGNGFKYLEIIKMAENGLELLMIKNHNTDLLKLLAINVSENI